MSGEFYHILKFILCVHVQVHACHRWPMGVKVRGQHSVLTFHPRVPRMEFGSSDLVDVLPYPLAHCSGPSSLEKQLLPSLARVGNH